MEQTTSIALILGFWASLYLLDAYFKGHHRLQHWYINFLNHTGLSVSVGQLRWYTTWFNRLFLRMGQVKPHLLKAWFNCGVIFGFVMMLVSICLLTLLVYNTLQSKPVEQQVLTPVMPGINLPMNQIVYYLLTLLVCGILHEVGHALAAVSEQVRVNGFGIFIVALYPGAYVDLYTEHLQSVSPLRQLRIYCAGVWHNFIIVLVAIGVLIGMPWLMSPAYTMGQAIVITHVTEQHACLPARGTTERPQCRLQSDCYQPNHPAMCVVPSLDNTTKLLRVSRNNKAPLLFLGHPLDMHYAVMISNYVPTNSFIPLDIPYIVETFSKYIISLSGALAVLNVVPCYALDGQWILMGFIEYGLKSVIPSAETRGLLYTVMLLFGTVLLFSNVTIAMYSLFR